MVTRCRPRGPYGGEGARFSKAVASVLTASAMAAVAASPTACGTDAVGVDSCLRVEEARCRRAPSCGISLDPPHRSSGDAVSACIRFYDIECLHGLEVADPGAAAVGACTAAIAADETCAAVVSPESAPACAWLRPPGSSSADAAAGAAEAAEASDAQGP